MKPAHVSITDGRLDLNRAVFALDTEHIKGESCTLESNSPPLQICCNICPEKCNQQYVPREIQITFKLKLSESTPQCTLCNVHHKSFNVQQCALFNMTCAICITCKSKFMKLFHNVHPCNVHRPKNIEQCTMCYNLCNAPLLPALCIISRNLWDHSTACLWDRVWDAPEETGMELDHCGNILKRKTKSMQM